MSATRKEDKSTDDLQNGESLTVEERLDRLEKLVSGLVEKNCLLKPE